jgi:nitrite reductase/ring-hydroxylating ferredoxin subunit
VSSGDGSRDIDLARVICPLHELDDPGARGFVMGEGDWPLRGFVVRRGALLRAYVNHCPHAGFPLNASPDAFLAPGAPVILCSMHGALFDVETGACISGPCEGLSLRALPVQVEGGYVMLAAGVRLEEPYDLG